MVAAETAMCVPSSPISQTANAPERKSLERAAGPDDSGGRRHSETRTRPSRKTPKPATFPPKSSGYGLQRHDSLTGSGQRSSPLATHGSGDPAPDGAPHPVGSIVG